MHGQSMWPAVIARRRSAGSNDRGGVMELTTSRFGPVNFTLEEVVLIPEGLGDRWQRDRRRWLLLHDRLHSRLYWLQCLDHTDSAIPVVALNSARIRLPRATFHQLGISAASPIVALMPLGPAAGHPPESARGLILVDPKRRIGRQVAWSAFSYDSTPSAQSVRARKVA